MQTRSDFMAILSPRYHGDFLLLRRDQTCLELRDKNRLCKRAFINSNGWTNLIQSSYTFSDQKFKDFSRTFQDLPWKFQGLFLWNLPQINDWCACLRTKKIAYFGDLLIALKRFEVQWNNQGLSRTENQFQVLSRPWIFILKIKDL